MPINGIILIEDVGGLPKLIYINDKTSIDDTTTIAELLALTDQWNTLGGDFEVIKTNFTSTLNQTTFTLSYNINSVDIFVGGIKLDDTEYVASSGTEVILNNPVDEGTWVQVLSNGSAPDEVYWETIIDSIVYYCCDCRDIIIIKYIICIVFT